jgi:ribonuclease HI
MSRDLVIHTDGGARGNPGPSGVGVVVFRDGKVVYELSKYIGTATNNEAEYKAFLMSLDWVVEKELELKPARVTWRLDSKLVVEQVNKNWKVKLPHLRKLAEEAWEGLEKLSCPHEIGFVPREENSSADALVNQALDAR